MTEQKKVKGVAYTTSSGERRIKLVDLKTMADKRKKEEELYEVRLGDIILGGATFEGRDEQEIRIAPLNMKGMAALERTMGNDLDALSTGKIACETTIKLATALINQDRSVETELTEDEVGRAMPIELMPIVNQLVEEMLNPLFAHDEASTQSQNQTAGA